MRYIITTILVFTAFILSSQALNDDCENAINIPSIDNYCSGNEEFNNIDATGDPTFTNNCFINNANGVWFSFVPTEPAVIFQIFSGGEFGTLQDPKMALFTGICNNLTYISCSPGRALFEDEFTVGDLTIGQRYYLFVESGVSTPGTFRLCINDFIAPPSPESDCVDAVVLCDKSPFQVESLTTNGNDPNELSEFMDECLTSEFNSSWYKWTCDDPGSLTFTLTPNNFIAGFESDDIDFALFELPNGIDDCSGKIMLRCMASGANGTAGNTDPFPTWQVCNGPTGLMIGDGDISEAPGCQGGDNNFADAIQMEADKSYALVVMNFSASGLGFSIDFGGTGTFLGPEPNFDLFSIDAFECDKRIEITNSSQSLADPIVNYAWNFGVGAEPQNASGEGPHNVLYESFGEKSITLTVETSRGCIVRKILDVDVAACCADTTSIDLVAEPFDVSCFNEDDGVIAITPLGGVPDHVYSINGGQFLPNTSYQGLPPGNYDVTIQDIKGCEETVTVTIDEPAPILPDAGTDLTIDLGFSGQLFANYSPMNPGDVIEWTPPDGLSCSDCLDPEVISPGTTVYTFTVTDIDGCSSADQVTVTTNIVRPIYIPNVITPTTQTENSTFVIGLGPQAELIEELCVFDRWGNIIFVCKDIVPNDASRGWDGRVGTCDGVFEDLVDSGVYVWTAKIRFIDGEVITYADDITVLK